MQPPDAALVLRTFTTDAVRSGGAAWVVDLVAGWLSRGPCAGPVDDTPEVLTCG